MTRTRTHYELTAKDVDGFGGDVVIERWMRDDIRLLVIEKNIVTPLMGEKRANLVLSPGEARRLAKQLIAFAVRRKR